MKARMPAGFGRPDMNALMRQAQKMQEDMKAKQAELEAAEYTGSASGEMVTVRMNGKHEILGITIKPEAVDPDDIEMLEDLVAAAVNATVKQVDETAEAEMGKLTGGLNIPASKQEGYAWVTPQRRWKSLLSSSASSRASAARARPGWPIRC